LLALVLTISCGGPLVRWPAGAGVPASDGSMAWSDAAAACRDVKTYVADLHVKGRVEGTRFPEILIGTQLTPTRVGLSAVAGSTIIFQLVGTESSATLHWRDGNRVLTAPAADIIEAVVGLRVGPAALMSIAGGCGSPGVTFQSAERFDERLIVTLDAGRAELVHDGRWRIRAEEARGIGVRYDSFTGPLPRSWRLWSGDVAAPAADLDVRASSPDARPGELGAEAFPPLNPAGADPMTLDELRRMVRRE
jgi:hypothetical protein